MELFAPLPPDVLRITASIPALIDKVFPLPGRFRSGLPKDVAELSRLLTSGRGDRELSYLSRPGFLSAYLRYFLPWNIFRLCRLLPGLDISLSPGDMVLDLGSGPLSLAAALWISRPELRDIALELRCVDRTGTVLEAGKKFFTALAGKDCPWKIVTVRGTVTPRGTLVYAQGGNTPAKGKHTLREKSAALVCAVNVFNEIYGSPGNSRDLAQSAACAARLMDFFAAASASILTVEPGIPRGGEFISHLRGALIEKKRLPLSPCLHTGDCPFPGGGKGMLKKRWCHFAFETEDAPPALHTLSAAAGIPKERAVLSFLFAGPFAAHQVLPSENDGAPSAKKQAAISRPEKNHVTESINNRVVRQRGLTVRSGFEQLPLKNANSAGMYAAAGEPKVRWRETARQTSFARPGLTESQLGQPTRRNVVSQLSNKSNVKARVISDVFPLPGMKGCDLKFGRYCCSQRGLVLLTGKRESIEGCRSGALIDAVLSMPELLPGRADGEISPPLQRDAKSGALMAELARQTPAPA